MTQTDYDLFVIGGGSGGVRAARVAASHGAKVAIAEEYRLGGTCVIRGCVPKKLLVYASRFGDDFEDAAGYGWTLGAEPKFDWATLIASKDREIDRLERAYESNLQPARRHHSEERARARRAERRAPERRLACDGARDPDRDRRPSRDRPRFEGRRARHHVQRGLSPRASSAPRRGCGRRLYRRRVRIDLRRPRCRDHLIYRGEKVLRGFDEDLRDDLMLGLERRGVRLVMMDHLTRIDKSGDAVFATTNDGKSIEANTIMAATGRRPNTGLGLESGRGQCWHHGEIIVDAFRTTAPGIYAVGDVTNRVNLTPVAIREGHAFADSVFGGKLVSVDHTLVPTAVFSTPRSAPSGSEAAAREASPIDIYKARFRPMSNTLSGRDERMLMKLVVDAETERVLGCHVLGPDATEMVQMAAIAMRWAPKSRLRRDDGVASERCRGARDHARPSGCRHRSCYRRYRRFGRGRSPQGEAD